MFKHTVFRNGEKYAWFRIFQNLKNFSHYFGPTPILSVSSIAGEKDIRKRTVALRATAFVATRRVDATIMACGSRAETALVDVDASWLIKVRLVAWLALTRVAALRVGAVERIRTAHFVALALVNVDARATVRINRMQKVGEFTSILLNFGLTCNLEPKPTVCNRCCTGT